MIATLGMYVHFDPLASLAILNTGLLPGSSKASRKGKVSCTI